MTSSSFKSSLRKTLRHLRDGFPVEPVKTLSVVRNVGEYLLSNSQFNTVGFYLPIFHEVNLVPLMTLWLESNPTKSAAIPVIEDGEMFFAAWSPDIPLVKGLFNTQIPKECIKVHPDVLLIPCLGFDQAKFRLGYGGGWYDRYLQQANPRPFTIGVAYSHCALDTIHPEETDIPLDLIITDQTVI